jgi:hypothetical protein
LVKAAVVYQLCWRITLRLEGKIAIVTGAVQGWEGAVITEAGNDPQVAGLVYVAAGDRAIPPAVESDSAKRMKATTLTLASSHVPTLSQPDKVADFILEAVTTLNADSTAVNAGGRLR